MTIAVYASATSVVAGDTISLFASNSAAGPVNIRVVRVGAAEIEVFKGQATVGPQPLPAELPAVGCGWPKALDVPTSADWGSGLYRALLRNAAGEADNAEFVVRPASPVAPILVCVPFATFVAYDNFSGKNLYGNEDPARSTKVTFDQPHVVCSEYEVPFFPFLDTLGVAVEYCSSLDLHAIPDLLSRYQMLVSIGHDEYWSAEMRQAVETFVAGGGNAAFFSANTCWWQVRFEDNDRSMICYKDHQDDPLTASQPHLATVRWYGAPLFRPENALTGVSFRRGAGCWDDPGVMATAAFTTRFANHWVFNGTTLKDGDAFGTGFVGYETDAADYVDTNGIPWATGRDGTPPGFVILATADLGDWRRVGQGGDATMGIYTRGGTVFNAATIGWSKGLAQPGAVATITRNVLLQLAVPWPGDNWEVVGEANGVSAMTASENRLFGTAGSRLIWRPPVMQNLHWEDLDVAVKVVALAAPTEAAGKRGIKLFAADSDGNLWWRDPLITATPWEPIGQVPPGVTTLVAANDKLFGCTGAELMVRDSRDNAAAWSSLGTTPPIVAMTALNGRLFAVTKDKKLFSRPPVDDVEAWTEIGSVPDDATALAGAGGRLFLATTDDLLWSRAPG